MKKLLIGILLVPLLASGAQRLKDLGYFQGMRPNQLIGYGLVVGLRGTGDKRGTWFTVQSLANMLTRMGITVDSDQIKVKNVAAVMVTAKLPPFAKPGMRIDVTVSSLGDATSLQGGTLLMTPLRGPDGNIYAVAQGPVLVGGSAAAGAAGEVAINIPTVGRIPGGAIVEKGVPLEVNYRDLLKFNLFRPDFTTAKRAEEAIDTAFGGDVAKVLDAATILIRIPPDRRHDVPGLIAMIEGLQVEPDWVSRVVVDERTGTVVIGEGVRIRPVAVSHGNITVEVKERPWVSQPEPFSRGETVVVPETEITIEERQGHVALIEGTTVGELVRALNALGVTTRDLISILQAIREAGALEGELEVM